MRASVGAARGSFKWLVGTYGSLVASILPGAMFATFLGATSTGQRWLAMPTWDLGLIFAAGTLATIAGILDWRLHRALGVKVGPRERRVELMALVFGGLPLFGWMTLATAFPNRGWLIPVTLQTIVVGALVGYDEWKFHRRRCSPKETVLHRILVFGQAFALLGWVHFSFFTHRGQHT